MHTSEEATHIYLLSVLPHEHPELKIFIEKMITDKATEKTKIDIVSEDQVQVVAERIKAEIETHS